MFRQVGEAVARHLVAGKVVTGRIVGGPLRVAELHLVRGVSARARATGNSTFSIVFYSRQSTWQWNSSRPDPASRRTTCRIELARPIAPLDRHLGPQPACSVDSHGVAGGHRQRSPDGTDRRPTRRRRSAGRRRAAAGCPARPAPPGRCAARSATAPVHPGRSRRAAAPFSSTIAVARLGRRRPRPARCRRRRSRRPGPPPTPARRPGLGHPAPA